jgi:hypothetical protein
LRADEIILRAFLKSVRRVAVFIWSGWREKYSWINPKGFRLLSEILRDPIDIRWE